MPRAVLIHGFTQTAKSWPNAVVAALTNAAMEVRAVDVPGHGDASAARADLVTAAKELATLGPAHFIGYSLGGRLALHVAIHTPDAVDKLVLIGATAGIEDDTERAARRAADEELAQQLERDGVEALLDRWLANPLFATLPRDRASLDDRRRNTAAGLAASLRMMGTGMQRPLWDRLCDVHQPVLFITGALDAKFTALANRMAELWGGQAEVATVGGAGHAVHLERPDEVASLIAAFLGHATTSANERSAP